MRKYDFDKVVDRTKFFSAKWSLGQGLIDMGYTERFDENTISVFTADMDFECPDSMKEACHKVADHNVYGYCWLTPENCDYYPAVMNWFKTKRDWEFTPDEITYVPSTIDAIKFAIECLTKEGDGVMINRPIYTPFSSTITKTKRKVVNSQLVNDEGYYTVDFEDFEKKAADENTTAFILCNPHNPTGRVWSVEELRKMITICRKYNVIVIADEIHGDLCRMDVEFHPVVKACGPEGIVAMTSLNKTFNMAGLQAANVVIQDEKLNRIYRDYVGFIMPNIFTIAAVIAAYREGDEWLTQVREYLDGTVDWVIDFLKERMPKVKCHRPEGTYIMWMDFREYGLTAEEIHQKIYIDANIVLEGGREFDPEYGAGFERICIPTRRSLIQEAFERIAKEFENC